MTVVCFQLSVVCSEHLGLCSTHSVWRSDYSVLCSQHLSCVHNMLGCAFVIALCASETSRRWLRNRGQSEASCKKETNRLIIFMFLCEFMVLWPAIEIRNFLTYLFEKFESQLIRAWYKKIESIFNSHIVTRSSGFRPCRLPVSILMITAVEHWKFGGVEMACLFKGAPTATSAIELMMQVIV